MKVDGYYKTPSIAPGESSKVDRLDATTAGDNLIVLKTGPGNANRAGFIIDRSAIPGILGTIAGDDTVLVIGRDPQGGEDLVRRFLALAQHTSPSSDDGHDRDDDNRHDTDTPRTDEEQ